jgi:hypothetical protein
MEVAFPEELEGWSFDRFAPTGAVLRTGFMFLASCSGLLDNETKRRPKYPKHKRLMPT